MSAENKISYYDTAKAVAPSGDISIKDFIGMIRDQSFADGVALVRAATTEDAKKAAKLELPAVQLSGRVTKGNRAKAIQEGRFEHSGHLQLDVDDDGLNGKTPEEARALLGKDRHVLSAFVTPSGTGAKGLFKIKPCITDEEHKAAFRAMEIYILETYGFTLDTGTKDTGRLCFMSSDPGCTWNPFAEEFIPPVVEPMDLPPASESSSAPREDGDFSLAETAEDVRALLAAIPPRPEYMEWLTVCSAVWDAVGEIVGTSLLQEWSPEESAGEYAAKYSDRLKNVHAGTLVAIAKANGFDTKRAAAAKHAERDGPSPRVKGPWDKRDSSSAPKDGGKATPSPDEFRAMLAARAFDAANPPPMPVPVIKLGGKCIATVGNIQAVQAGIKSGKTATVGAIVAAFIIDEAGGDHDTLGFTASNPEGHAVLHFDTEQSRYDHDGVIRKALSRAGMDEPPEWFQSYCLTDMSQQERMRAIETIVADAVISFGGVRGIILDGIADFMRDPNDGVEAFAFVDKLHKVAITQKCVVVCVIHENPNSDKTRGHLGSHLARKSETNLRLHKDPSSGITTIWADYARHCHIPKDAGTCFAWCDTMGRHISKGTAGAIKANLKTEKFRDEAEKAFGGADSLTYSALHTAIMDAVGIAFKTAEARIKTYQAEGIIFKTSTGSYSLK